MEPLAAGDPRQVGVYRLHFRLGAGGMGRVFLGFSPADRAVAVKVIHPEYARDPEFVERFRREVRAAEAISGAFTAPVVAAGPNDDPPWLATAFVAGPSLADLIKHRGPLPEAAVWRLAGGLIEALQAVHEHGLVHRDLKPNNVLIATDGPRVIDFGISRALEGTVMTPSRTVVGTPGFMSPEQVQGQRVGFPSDVFALGSVIAFAATGAAPFEGGDMVAISYRVVHVQPDLTGMPVSLRNLVASCLAKAPVDRPPLGRLLHAVMAESAFYPGISPANFWSEPVAGLISSYQDSFGIQVASPAESGPVAAMSSPPHEPIALSRAESSEDDEEATRTATALPGIGAVPLIDRPDPSVGQRVLAEVGDVWQFPAEVLRQAREEAQRPRQEENERRVREEARRQAREEAWEEGRHSRAHAAQVRDELAERLPIRERISGPEHPDTLAARRNLAYWTGEAGDAAGARDQFAALLPARERVSGPEHPHTLAIRYELARFTGLAGDAVAARDQLAALLPIRQRISGLKHRETQIVQKSLAYWTSKARSSGTA